VKWYDGKPFTADDVVFSLDQFLREVHPRWRPIADAEVEKIEKIDDLTVSVRLKQPFGPLLMSQEVASAPMVPKHVYEGTNFRTNPADNTPIGTGPYKFSDWSRGSYIHLVKNLDYWLEGKPYFEDVYWEIIPDAAARAVAYETGKVDVLTGGSVDVCDVQRLEKLPNTCVTTGGWEMFAPLAWLAAQGIGHSRHVSSKFALGIVGSTIVITLELETSAFRNSGLDQSLKIGDGNFINGFAEHWLETSKKDRTNHHAQAQHAVLSQRRSRFGAIAGRRATLNSRLTAIRRVAGRAARMKRLWGSPIPAAHQGI
jgi:hypothetical protein